MELGLIWTFVSLQGVSQTKPGIENLRGLGLFFFFFNKISNKVSMAILPSEVGFVHCSVCFFTVSAFCQSERHNLL